MVLKEFSNEDVVLSHWNTVDWNTTSGTIANLVVICKLYGSKYLLGCQDHELLDEAGFDLDQDYFTRLENTYKLVIAKKWLGWKICILNANQISHLIYHPYQVGDKISLSCSINDGVIWRITRPNHQNTEIRQFEIIGRIFNKTSLVWQHEYAVLIPNGSTTGIVISPEDIVNWEIDPTLYGRLFQGVLRSEIISAKITSSGMNCMNPYCKIFAEWADQPNCPNGIFLCYGCKNNPITYALIVDP